MLKVKTVPTNAQALANPTTAEQKVTPGAICMAPSQSTPPPAAGRFLSSKTVAGMFGYKNRACFYAWVWAESVPCIRLSSRKIVFPEAALNHWLAARSNTGGIR